LSMRELSRCETNNLETEQTRNQWHEIFEIRILFYSRSILALASKQRVTVENPNETLP